MGLPFDLTDLDNFAQGFPHEMFVVHRTEAPVVWHEPTQHTPDGEGFWSVATYAETYEVLTDAETYSSEKGGHRPYGGTLLQDMPVAGIVLNMMDDPRHARVRRLVSMGFTPRRIQLLDDQLRGRTQRIVARIEDGVEFDMLRDVVAELPMQAICILLGVPEADRHELFEAVEHVFDFRDGRESFETNEGADAAQSWMFEYGAQLIAEKRTHPADDMLSVVVHAELPDEDPSTLTDIELYMFFSLLFAAGSETTRNAIAGGMLALLERPDQLAVLQDDLGVLPGAIEEMLRWTTPSPSKRRTATRPVELAGHAIAAGDKVLFWEASANRDEQVFERSMEFDIRRDPNPHLAFGHGLHHCLGASLARLETRVVFDVLLSEFASFELAGAVEWTRSNRHTGIRTMPMRAART